MKKIGIYAACIFGYAIISVLTKYAGIMLGGLPTALLGFCTLALANFLCKKYVPEEECEKEDEDWMSKDEEDEK